MTGIQDQTEPRFQKADQAEAVLHSEGSSCRWAGKLPKVSARSWMLFNRGFRDGRSTGILQRKDLYAETKEFVGSALDSLKLQLFWLMVCSSSPAALLSTGRLLASTRGLPSHQRALQQPRWLVYA